MTPAAMFAKGDSDFKGGRHALVYADAAPRVYDAAGDARCRGAPTCPTRSEHAAAVAPPAPPPVAVEECPTTPAPHRPSQTRAGDGVGRRRWRWRCRRRRRSCRLSDLAAGAGEEVGLSGRGAAALCASAVPALLDDGATRLAAATLAEAAVRLAFAAAAKSGAGRTTTVWRRARRGGGRKAAGGLGPAAAAGAAGRAAGERGGRFVPAAAALGRGTGSFDRFWRSVKIGVRIHTRVSGVSCGRVVASGGPERRAADQRARVTTARVIATARRPHSPSARPRRSHDHCVKRAPGRPVARHPPRPRAAARAGARTLGRGRRAGAGVEGDNGAGRAHVLLQRQGRDVVGEAGRPLRGDQQSRGVEAEEGRDRRRGEAGDPRRRRPGQAAAGLADADGRGRPLVLLQQEDGRDLVGPAAARRQRRRRRRATAHGGARQHDQGRLAADEADGGGEGRREGDDGDARPRARGELRARPPGAPPDGGHQECDGVVRRRRAIRRAIRPRNSAAHFSDASAPLCAPPGTCARSSRCSTRSTASPPS